MRRYLFFDLSNDGHHFSYNSAVMQGIKKRSPKSEIFYYSNFKDEKRKTELIKQGFKVEEYTVNLFYKYLPGILIRIILLFKAIVILRKNKCQIFHLLYLDNLMIPLFFLIPLIPKIKITGTLHWYPNRKSKQILLGFILNKEVIQELIVHGEFIRNQVVELLQKNRKQVTSIIYPNLHPLKHKHTERAAKMLKDNLIKREHKGAILLCFGGLRHDKGIDILLEAAGRIIDRDFTILIAGKEDTFTRNYVDKEIARLKLENKVVMNLEYISDDDVEAYFNLSDIVILPYRKIFSGQSGPLTEGAIRNKIIIGPDHGEIGDTIKRYQLGIVFKAEDISDLSNKLIYTFDNLDYLSKRVQSSAYKDLIRVEVFQDQYHSILYNDDRKIDRSDMKKVRHLDSL